MAAGDIYREKEHVSMPAVSLSLMFPQSKAINDIYKSLVI